MARVVKSLLLLLGVAAGFQAAPLLRPASQAAVSRCAADSIQVRAALFSKHGGSLEGSLELDACNALPSGGAGAVAAAAGGRAWPVGLLGEHRKTSLTG